MRIEGLRVRGVGGMKEGPGVGVGIESTSILRIKCFSTGFFLSYKPPSSELPSCPPSLLSPDLNQLRGHFSPKKIFSSRVNLTVSAPIVLQRSLFLVCSALILHPALPTSALQSSPLPSPSALSSFYFFPALLRTFNFPISTDTKATVLLLPLAYLLEL